ncbi:MAG: TrkA family potassium uptake protein [Eubacteriales bacterium]|nr:TrkA family potassium uptake protein [Eubacteriales bacterium]MDD4324371.1 TrkA family potassium uptake protein [Eubacteriales bacterium]MDD4540822.1 TrkA family potassium uptake protein [Eubacteriales bacterium]
MQVLILGAGKVGRELAASLLKRDDQVVLLDNDPAFLQLAEHIDCTKITGDMTDKEILRSAQIETADVVCAVADSDNINIMVTWVATKIFNVPRVLTRLYNPQKKNVFKALGMETISSTDFTVNAFLHAIEDEETVLEHKFFNDTLSYTLLDVPPDMLDSELADLQTSSGQIIIGLRRGNTTHLISENPSLEAGDRIILADLK